MPATRTETKAKVAPYGTWDSPISSASAVTQTTVVSYVFVDPITHQVYHIEQRPAECGRSVIVHSRSSTDLFDRGSSWNARSAVHEYGGGAAAAHDDILYFSNVGDGRLYKFSVAVQDHANIIRAEPPSPVTPAGDRKRYASLTPHPAQRHLLVAVLEDHTHGTPSTVVNSLVCVDTRTSTVYPLITGADFYAAPTFSPDGTKLAWQAWNHPHMPWVGTTIWVADLTFPTSTTCPPMQATNHVRIAASVDPQPTRPGSSVSYVSWLDDDALLFLAETSGWRNPWVYRLSLRNAGPVLKAPIQEDFASVYKLLGASYYAPLDFAGSDHDHPSQGAREMLFVAYRGGQSVLYIVDLARQGRVEAIELECPFVDVSCVRAVGSSTGKDVAQAQVVFIASSTAAPSTVKFCSISRLHNGYKASFSSTPTPLVEDLALCLSLPLPMTLTDSEGEPLHIVYYAPLNPAFIALDGERPPCVVNVHGGPTLVALQSLDWMKQWYTSRGWAWLDVNYRGSSLYGRKYTDQLDGQWGVLDVLDCIRAAHVLSSPPYSLVDPARCVIRGVSAGGYTVLSYAAGTYRADNALCRQSPAQADTDFIFRAGTSYFGIADLAALACASHKFESHYILKLLGSRPDESSEMTDVYHRRSPVFHADRITTPLLMLQGLADCIVPPEQSQAMVDAIVAHGGSDRVKYRTYEGEGHGFGRADTHKSALEEEATWFARWLGIEIRL